MGHFLPKASSRALIAALAVCSALVGCCHNCCDLKGEGFKDDSLSAQCRQYRTPDPSTPPVAVSSKGQEVERSLGIGQ